MNLKEKIILLISPFIYYVYVCYACICALRMYVVLVEVRSPETELQMPVSYRMGSGN